jgi:hypothetical protein
MSDIRRQLWEYDQVLNTQRDKVYLERRKALVAKDLSPLLVEYAERTVDDILEVPCPLLLGAVNSWPPYQRCMTPSLASQRSLVCAGVSLHLHDY